MKPSTFLWLAMIGLIIAGFFAVLVELLHLRTDTGNAFPEYSTYRADPMGAQALYNALREVPGLQVERNERNIKHFQGGEDTALLILGAYESPDPVRVIQHLEEFVFRGGRLAILYGIRGQRAPFCLDEGEAAYLRDDPPSAQERINDFIGEKEVPAFTPPPAERRELGAGMTLSSERWGYRVVAPMTEQKFADAPRLTAGPVAGGPFSTGVTWHSPEYLLPQSTSWQVLMTAGEGARPVMMRRSFGKGEIVVATDSYFVSNEALRHERRTDLLAWLVRDKQRVVFEETTKGVQRGPGIAGLMKRYRLHVMIASMVTLALLYVWRGAAPLLPRRSDEEARERALLLQGRDAHAGLAALLRRAAPPDVVLKTCLEEWRQALGRLSTSAPADIASAERVLSEDLSPYKTDLANEVVTRYRAAAKLLRQRRTGP